jgi:hypothetical protein
MLVPERTAYALVFYCLCMSLISIYRPSALFRNHKPRPFGLGDKTLISLSSAMALAIFSMALFTIIDIIGDGLKPAIHMCNVT